MEAELFLDAGAELAEGPVWDDRQNELVWIDILRGQIHRTSEDGSVDDVTEMGEHVGAVALMEDGGMLAATRSGFRVVDPSAGHPLLAEMPDGGSGLRMNDGKCDPRGRFVAGTMAYDERSGAGSLYSYDGVAVTRLLSDVTISNGLAWSSDGATMYYVDTPTRRVDAFDYDVATGEISDRRPEIVLAEGVGDPDGITIDDEGGLWVSLWGGGKVHRYQAGRLTESIAVPSPMVTSCCFAGIDRRRLQITTAADPNTGRGGALYAIDPGVAGLPAHRARPALSRPGGGEA